MRQVRQFALAALAAALVLGAGLAPAGAGTKLLRFPDIHGDRVVFVYAGDLWIAPVTGGTATRLTSHPGLELFPRFSPDGKWIAFTAQYGGDEQVWVIPSSGGAPRQLTWYPAKGPLPDRWGFDNQVIGWTPDGSAVVFRSLREAWGLVDSRLYTVKLDGSLPEPLPMPYSGAGDFSPDGKRIVYSPLVRDFRTWKRYRGGWAQELYIFDLATHETTRVTKNPYADRDPMWIGDAIWFTSDRSGTNNLYRYDVATGKVEQVTHETTWDVRWPSSDGTSRIVYELNGELEILDVASRRTTHLDITVPLDTTRERPAHLRVSEWLEGAGIGPTGKRAVFVARGEVFSVPVEHGVTRNLTRSSGAHDRDAAWSPDGKTIAFVSDRSGEDQLWLVDASGTKPPRQLTRDEDFRAYLQDPAWSPDGKRIAFHDQAGRLYVIEVDTGKWVQVADDITPFGLDYTWSPDSRWLAFSLAEPTQYRSLWLWKVGWEKPRRVTGPTWNEHDPSWSPDGKYLYYLSERTFAPQMGQIEWNYVTDRMTGIFALTLKKGQPGPVPPRNDEEGAANGGKEKAAAGKDDDAKDRAKKKKGKKGRKGGEEAAAKEKEEGVVVEIDLEGLADRVTRMPIEADDITTVAAVEGGLLYVVGGPWYYGRSSDVTPTLKFFDLEKRESKDVAEGVGGFDLSADGKKLLARIKGSWYVLDAKPGGEKKQVSLDGLQADIVPVEEWNQIFHEVWRRYRDFFYVPNMHGYDWEGLRKKYEAWLPSVAHRMDLNYVIGEMIAELSIGHAYIAGGAWGKPDRPRAGLLGARFALDPDSGRYRISYLLPGQNEEEVYRNPLRAPGIDVKQGDYLLAINGVELSAPDNPYRHLLYAAGGPVQLTVNDRPTLEGARTVTVEPIGSEAELNYLDWILKKRALVEKLSHGRLGYLHIPDMGAEGIREFIKWFYGQEDREGLVIDVRHNGGGNVSQMIISRLARKLLMVSWERNADIPDPYPSRAFNGRLIALCNEDTASDGDQFSYIFRKAGLGKLVGKRTWGGVVGIYGRAPLVDGGTVYVPESAAADLENHWVIEGWGVEPDIVVENDPKSLLEGRDPQLERAVEELLREIDEHPAPKLHRPEPPCKTPECLAEAGR